MRAHSQLSASRVGLTLALWVLLALLHNGFEVPDIKRVSVDPELTTYSMTKSSSGRIGINGNVGDFEVKTKHTRRMPIVIPVVVNIIHSPDQSGLLSPFPDDASVVAGIDWINNLLAGGPACPGDPISVEIGIQLCIASRDIQGNATTGIRRFGSELSEMDLCKEDAALKAVPRENGNLFPDTSYINIYIVEDVCASCKPGDCLAGGYAAYPSAHGTIYDGIVVEAITWMNQSCDVRKVILHELGHYFNLRHTWEGNSCENDNCLLDGDGVCDTPPDFDINIYASNPCLQGIPVSTCISDVNPSDPNNPFLTDEPDMTSNLMDYAPPGCIAMFTEGQAERMRNAISGPRNSLLRSNGCSIPCPDPVILNIQWPSSPFVFGESIEILNLPQTGVTYSWIWYGGTALSQNLNMAADSIGTFVVCVEATGPAHECFAKECDTIIVSCSYGIPEISLSDYQINLGEEIILTHTSTPVPGYTYTWYINGIPSGVGTSTPYTPTLPGSTVIWLEECGSGCCSESQHAYLSVGSCPSGKEANHWFFGRDRIHLDWNSGAPIEQPPSSAWSDEAMAIAVDATGSLLFYSNNEFVYNRDGLQMPNGRLITYFSGGNSATHVLTLPRPGSDSLWYLIYPETLDSGNPGRDTITTLYLAIIDMSLDGGHGNVTLKDQPILRPTTEKVAAVRHCNGIDWWIVGHEANATTGSNRFYSWLLSSTGLSTPIISAVGRPKARTAGTKAGELNISPDGLHIAMSTGPDFENETTPGYTVEVFDFDPSTGIVSNDILIRDYIYQTFGLGLGDAYGLEFSPSGDFLYVARGAFVKDSLFQYDIRSGNPQIIQQSEINIYKSIDPTEDSFGAMLTAPNNKIYIADFQHPNLMVINNPDLRGMACDFESHGIDLQQGDCFLGLPTFPAGIYTPGKPYLSGPSVICDTINSAKFFVKANCRYQDYIWKTTGNSEVISSQGDTVWIKPVTAGIEHLIVERITACGIKTDTFTFEIESCKSITVPCSVAFDWNEADTVVCRGEDAWIHFNTQATSISYTLASDGIEHALTSPIIFLTQPQQDDHVMINLRMNEGCDTTFQVGIHVNPALQVQIGPLDTLICKGENASILINHDPNYLVELFSEDNQWVITNPAWPLEVGSINSDSTIYVRIRDFQMSCDSIFTWKIRVEEDSPYGIDTTWICNGDSVIHQGNWFKRDTTITQNFARIGCDSLHSTVILMREPLSAILDILNPCAYDNGVINVEIQSGKPPFNYSINGGTFQSSPKFTHLAEGSYLIEVIDNLGCKFDTTILLQEGVSIEGVELEVANPSCNYDNGKIEMHSLTSGVQYSINGGSFLPDTVFTALPAGNYQVFIMYPGGCFDTTETQLIQIGKPLFTGVTIDSSHCTQSDGSIKIVSVEGGDNPYQFQIGNSVLDTIRKFVNLPSGSYTLSVVDSNNCQSDTAITLPSISGPTIIDISVTPAICGLPQGSIEIEAISGSELLYQLESQPSSSQPYFSSLLPGLYLATVTDLFDCKSQVEIVVPDSFSIRLLDVSVSPEQCSKENGGIHFEIQGSQYTTSVLEFPGQIFSESINNLKSGEYHLSVQDEFMCRFDTLVEVGSLCEIYLPNVFSPNDDGQNDVFGQSFDFEVTYWELSVFDRSGNLVFQSFDPHTGWKGDFKGKQVQLGVYAWILNYKIPSDIQIKHKVGDVTIVR
ncbi:MAG TPA: M43 family zinc metalloprotease [Saprospiraceae bacterium]|nr:M43 family zinc metalloprotease [Saprospiraceae bacterium]